MNARKVASGAVASLMISAFAQPAFSQNRWTLDALFRSAQAGIFTGIGTERLTWGDPMNGAAEFTGFASYPGSPSPPNNISLGLIYVNGAQFVGTSVAGGP